MPALHRIESTASPWLIQPPAADRYGQRWLVEQFGPDELDEHVVEGAPVVPSAEPTLTSPLAQPSDRPLTAPSVVRLHDNRERVKARFRLLRRLRADHDNEGASAPSPESIDRAIAFVHQMRTFPPFFATLDDD